MERDNAAARHDIGEGRLFSTAFQSRELVTPVHSPNDILPPSEPQPDHHSAVVPNAEAPEMGAPSVPVFPTPQLEAREQTTAALLAKVSAPYRPLSPIPEAAAQAAPTVRSITE